MVQALSPVSGNGLAAEVAVPKLALRKLLVRPRKIGAAGDHAGAAQSQVSAGVALCVGGCRAGSSLK